MEINESCGLFLTDVYVYDITSCHYVILERLGFNLLHIDFQNKEKRNIQIGKMMRDNPQLTHILRKHTNSMIDEFLNRNSIKEDDIIIRQYDGVILKRGLSTNHLQTSIPVDLKEIFVHFLISSNRKMYIAFNGQKTSIKGVPYSYPKINEVLSKIIKINFSNKSNIFTNLQKIKDEFFISEDSELFCIPSDNGKFNVFLKQYGEIEISKNTINIMDPSDIDKQKYFDFYIRPFTESIVIEFTVRRK